MGRVIRGLSEHPCFRQQCAEIARQYGTDESYIDDVLNGLTWAISTNAEGFRFVPRSKRMRVGFAFGRNPVPALQVYFKILDEHNVELLWVQEDEGGYSYEAF